VSYYVNSKSSIILLKHRSKVPRGLHVNRRKLRKKGENLDLIFYVKGFEWIRFSLLKLIIYSSQILLIHIVNME
jgi:hypothetical protein